MAQIVLIKTADIAAKKLGDLVGIYDSDHTFSDLEKTQFDIHAINGFSRSELLDWLENNNPATRRIYRLSVANTWTDEIPEKKESWLDGSIWRFLEERPKYYYNFADFSNQDFADMANALVPKATKVGILETKTEFRITTESKNQVAV
jgi:hypothetical protein